MRTYRTKLGDLGEHHARLLLESAGMTYINSKWRAASGEIDLVMEDAEFVVIVEVKVRRGDRAGTAEEAISPAKAKRLLTTGEWFMASDDSYRDRPWRIDLVAITIDSRGTVIRSRHIRDAVVSG